MGKFFDTEAAKSAVESMLKSCFAEPGSQEVVQVQRFQLESLQVLPPMLATLLSKAIDAAHEAHEKRIAGLEERLRIAEVKGMRYRGTWTPDEHYNPGDFVTDGGSMWHCYASTRGRPGEASTDWVLAVKKGRDGKDAR